MPRRLHLFLDINVIGDDLQAKTGRMANIGKTFRAAESTILHHLISYYSTLSTTLDQKDTLLHHVMEQEVTAPRLQSKNNANRQRKLYKLRQEKAEWKESSRTSRPRRRAPASPFIHACTTWRQQPHPQLETYLVRMWVITCLINKDDPFRISRR